MKIIGISPLNELIAKLIFLVLPTACVAYFVLWNANEYYTILQHQAWQQSLYFLLGMAGAHIFYAFRFRFISSFLLLLLLFYSLYKGLDATAIGEFDSFFLSVQFLIFSTLFLSGWLVGAAFSRFRYAHYLLSALALLASVLLIAKQQSEQFEQLMRAFLPSVLYTVYLIFAAEQIFNYKDKSQRFWWFMSRRLVLFLLLSSLLLGSITYFMRSQFEQAIVEAGGGAQGESGMLQKNKNGDFDLKDYSQLRSNQGRSNELLFAAHIDNFLPGTDIPNPLYLTAFYYTKFDTSTETFERDKAIPLNDLYEPNVAQIPLYSARLDSSVIRNSLADKGRRIVEIEVYNKKLSPETYLAPHVGFFVQPIAVERDYRSEFRSAFRAKGYVSELNSAYFIYNTSNPQIKAFQEQRFSVLRKAGDYATTDPSFMEYYTRMPKDAKFQKITELTQRITANAPTTVDKVLAIRDYFLSKDEEGKPLFSYTDNPGVPDIPSASKLMYFLFENHKGYCAYYAGATLFMLRSIGIPSRITVGFMSIDRSDKNKGWYWYYADQAHAWIQVYIPGFGWLDFDTTVGNDEAQQSPSPDGTPPMQPPHAWLAAEGQIVAIDTLRKTMNLKTGQLIFHDKEFKAKNNQAASLLLDVQVANIQRDSIPIDLAKVQLGDSATVVSYAEQLKKMADPSPSDDLYRVVQKMPQQIPIDDVYLKKTKQQKEEEQILSDTHKTSFSWRDLLIYTLMVFALFALLCFSIPWMILRYYLLRNTLATSKTRKAYWHYVAFNFYVHQLGFPRGQQTPRQYAQEIVDAHFGTNFVGFMNVYLKMKYNKEGLKQDEWMVLNSFWKHNVPLLRKKISRYRRFVAFLRPLRSWAFYFSVPDNKE